MQSDRSNSELETLRRRVAALEASEQRYRALVEPSPVAIFVICDDMIVYANSAAAKLFGAASPEDFIGRRGPEFVHRDDRETTRRIVRRVVRYREEAPTSEARFLRLDGSEFRAEIMAIPYLHEGKAAAQVILHDITDRDRMEQALAQSDSLVRLITDTVPALIAYIGADLRYRFANKAYWDWYGLSRRDVVGRHVEDVIDAAALEALRPKMTRVLAGEEVSCELLAAYDRIGERFVRVVFLPDIDPHGKVLGFVSFVQDITDWKKTEAALAESEARSRTLFKSVPTPVYCWTRSGDDFVLTDYNDAALARTRGKVADYLETRARDFFADRPAILKAMRQSFADRATFSEEFDSRMKTTGERTVTKTTFAFMPPDTVLLHVVDITEAKAVEREIRRSEERYRSLVELSPDAILVQRTDGTVIYANDAAVRHFRAESREQLLRSTPADRVHPDDLPLVTEQRALLESGAISTLHLQNRNLCFDGSVVDADILVSSIDWEGAPALIIFTRDVTERKTAEDALRRNEAQFRALIESTSQGIDEIDVDGRIVYANPALHTLLHYPAGTLIGRRAPDLAPVGERRGARDHLAKLMSGALLPPVYYTHLMTAAGVKIDVEVNWTYKRSGDGRIVGLYRAVTDITDRNQAVAALRQSEELFRQMAEGIDDVVWTRSADSGDILYVNPAYERIWGESRESLLADPASFLKAIHPEDRDRIAASFATGPVVNFENEYRIVREDGSIRWIRARGYPIEGGRGESRRIVGIAEDITELKMTILAQRITDILGS